MLSLFQDIFGGSQSTTTSTPSNFNPFTSSLGGQTNTLGANLTSGLPQFNGPLAAGASGNENSLLQTLMGQTSQGGGVSGTNDTLSKIISGNMLPGQSGGNPFLSGAITAAQRTTMNNLTDTLSRSLPGYFTANGQMISPNDKNQGGSSAFDTAAALASQSAVNAMGDIASNISNNAWNTGVQQQTAGLGLSQAEVQTTINNLQAQSLPRMIQQMGIQNGLQLYQENLSGVLNLLATLGNITKPVLGTTTQSTSSSTPGILPDLAGFMPKGGGQNAGTGGQAAGTGQ